MSVLIGSIGIINSFWMIWRLCAHTLFCQCALNHYLQDIWPCIHKQIFFVHPAWLTQSVLSFLFNFTLVALMRSCARPTPPYLYWSSWCLLLFFKLLQLRSALMVTCRIQVFLMSLILISAWDDESIPLGLNSQYGNLQDNNQQGDRYIVK